MNSVHYFRPINNYFLGQNTYCLDKYMPWNLETIPLNNFWQQDKYFINYIKY